MKNITDYFSSPAKTRKSSEPVNSERTLEVLSEHSINAENEITKNSNMTEIAKETRVRKRKRRRKLTDPEVRNVAELLSNNLSLVSPNTSGTKINTPSPTKTVQKERKTDSGHILNVQDSVSFDLTLSKDSGNSDIKTSFEDTNNIIDNSNNISLNLNDTENAKEQKDISFINLTPKVNAFHFLMNSRNNIIGQNSDGRIDREHDDTISEEKPKLEARKSLFKNWAEQKGASKRKREEEEIEKCINLKMAKRAKRLKKFIQGDKKEKGYGENGEHEFPKKVKKKVQRLSSTESDISNEDTETTNSPLVKLTNILEENAQDIISKLPSPPMKKHTENCQNNLLSFFGVINKVDKEDIIEIFEESPKATTKEVIKIKMFTPQSTKSRTSLLSLNRNRTKSLDSLGVDESSQEDIKGRKDKKKKHKKNIQKCSQHELYSSGSMDNFCSSKNNGINKESRTSKLKLEEHFKNKLKTNIKLSESTNESTDLKNSNFNENLNKDSRLNVEVTGIIEVDNSTKDSDIRTVKGYRCKLNIIDDDSMNLVTNTNSKNYQISTKLSTKKKHVQKIKSPIEDSDEEKVDKPKHSSEHTSLKGRTLRKRSTMNYKEMININSPKSAKTDKEKMSCSARKSKRSTKDRSIEKVELSDSDYENSIKSKPKAPAKVAPVFAKATPKPKVDPEIIEARKKFLLSGIPDSLKKTVEKQKSIEEKEYDIFPTNSHIQQKCESKLWNLSNPNLNYKKSNYSPLLSEVHTFESLIVKSLPYEINLMTETEKVTHLKTFLQNIKSENPDYPVYKVFKHIYQKSGKNFLRDHIDSKRTPKRRSKKLQRKSTEIVVAPSESISSDFEIWTEKYKPRSSDEILGNYHSVKGLKKWLEIWLNYSEEINARKSKRTNSNSESEFESTDCDSRDSTRLPGNTMILYGPCGSGKTSAVYAIANELKLNVLELNASTKRTGKRLLQELQEATQSHQVGKNEANPLSNFMGLKKSKQNNKPNKSDIKDKTVKKSNSDEKRDKQKMCILLLEDIDLIFEQDEGFLSSLLQLIMTSKRPIILTTTDNTAPHVQKLVSQYECISFMPLSLQCLAIWLQVVCLVEGLLADKDHLGNLLEYNKGDIRKTLLEVQFWSQSGGQLEKNRKFSFITAGNGGTNLSNLKASDDELHIEFSEEEANSNEQFIHKNCLGSFEIFRGNEEYSIPQPVDLGMLWWNIPNLLDVPSDAAERLRRQKHSSVKLQQTLIEDNNDTDNLKLNSISKLYDSLVLTDSLFSTLNCHHSNEPIVKNWSVDVLDTLELTERKEDSNGLLVSMVHDISHTLVNGCIENYKKINASSCTLNMALPDSSERRWRANQHICEDFLKGPIPLSNTLDRRSIALDYLPTLRDIARSEEQRAASNTKRGNRFRHYFKDFNINFKQSTCKLACNILNIESI